MYLDAKVLQEVAELEEDGGNDWPKEHLQYSGDADYNEAILQREMCLPVSPWRQGLRRA